MYADPEPPKKPRAKRNHEQPLSNTSCSPDACYFARRNQFCDVTRRSHDSRVFGGKLTDTANEEMYGFALLPADCDFPVCLQALCCSAPTSSFFTYIAELKGHSRTPWTLSFHRQNPNLLVSGCLSGELRLWNLRQRACVKQAVLGQDRVTSVSFHPSSSVVAAACGRDLYLWDVETEEAPKKCLETTIGFLCCKLCVLATILSRSTYKKKHCCAWLQNCTRQLIPQWLMLACVFAVYFHPNGKWLLTCEVRSLGSGTGGSASPHTPHFCIRLRDREYHYQTWIKTLKHCRIIRNMALVFLPFIFSSAVTFAFACGI